MYYLKIEKENIYKVDSADEYVVINDNKEIVNILNIKNDTYVIGSEDEFLIDKCDELICFLNYYKKIKKVLMLEMDKYNSKLINEENIYIKELIEQFKELNSDGKFIRGFLA